MVAPRKYPVELQERAVRLWRSEQSRRPIAHLARELGVHPEALRNWIRQEETITTLAVKPRHARGRPHFSEPGQSPAGAWATQPTARGDRSPSSRCRSARPTTRETLLTVTIRSVEPVSPTTHCKSY
jgi:transposase-like protein